MRNVATIVAVVATAATAASAAPIVYGNFSGTTVHYLGVTEAPTGLLGPSATPFFGAPTLAGDALAFNPANFGVSSSNGGIDFKDSTLTTTIRAKPGFNINAIEFAETGDYTLAGFGTLATAATVNAALFLQIIELDGISVNPIQIATNLSFSPSGGTYDLVNDAGAGVIWNGFVSVDLDAAIANAGRSGSATALLFSLNNTLVVTSEQGTVSFLKKKAANGVTITTIVPEPASLGLLIGGLLLGLRRR
jgi:hypothetical protein